MVREGEVGDLRDAQSQRGRDGGGAELRRAGRERKQMESRCASEKAAERSRARLGKKLTEGERAKEERESRGEGESGHTPTLTRSHTLPKPETSRKVTLT